MLRPVFVTQKDRERLASALRAIVIGIWAVIGAVIAGSVIGYEVVVHWDFSSWVSLYRRFRL
jgi:hypothetical protein